MKSIPCFIPSSNAFLDIRTTTTTSLDNLYQYHSIPSHSLSPTTALSSTFDSNNNILNHVPTIISSSSESTTFLPEGSFAVLPILIAAIILGIASQTFINSMLKGDQGLGAFLQDGSGYSGSAFKPRQSKNKKNDGGAGAPLSGDDPLPWLKLPQFDFVEVAGQEKQQQQQVGEEEMARIEMRLNQIQQNMIQELEQGNVEEAKKMKEDLERLANEYGFEYREGFE